MRASRPCTSMARRARRWKRWCRSRKCPPASSDSTSIPRLRCWSPRCSTSPLNSRNRSWSRSPSSSRGRSRALELLVDLYLDPDIASPRKVSVWYAFWGEASSRQEYYDICGQKDESFAALVRDLIGRLIDETAQPHLDAGGIALGLIGVLEMLWQDFAFQSEANIDRQAAKRRCMAYLRSIFPGTFSRLPARAGEERRPARRRATTSPAWVYCSARALALERDALFQNAWQIAGHESQIPRAGDFLAVDPRRSAPCWCAMRGGACMRCATAVRNCRIRWCAAAAVDSTASSNARSMASSSAWMDGAPMPVGGFERAGRLERTAHAGMSALDLQVDRRVAARGSPKATRAASPDPAAGFDGCLPQGLTPLGPRWSCAVGADWKVLVEQWLEIGDARSCTACRRPIGWNGACGQPRVRGRGVRSTIDDLGGEAANGAWRRAIHCTESIAAVAARWPIDSAGDADCTGPLPSAAAALHHVCIGAQRAGAA